MDGVIASAGSLDHRRPTWIEIDLGALAGNYRAVRRVVGAEVEVMAVVKANAYGHGAAQCASRLRDEGARWFCVAIPEEAAELRTAGIIDERILCLGGAWGEQVAWCLAARVTPVIYRLDMARAFDAAARERGVIADIHLEIDTGMNRLGVRHDQPAEFARELACLKNVRVEAVMTHFAAADEPARDEFTRNQIRIFDDAFAAVRAAGHDPVMRDLANSAGVYAHVAARGSAVRPGGVLYGLWRDVLSPLDVPPAGVRPVMSWRTRVTLVKEVSTGETIGYGCSHRTTRRSRIVTLPVGYADGYPRALSNRGRVIVHGQLAPIVGRVSMDLTIIDVTDINREVNAGDLITLIGTDGKSSISAEELAAEAGTISYELTCGIGGRVAREYKD